jgi:hypothetical protein
MFVLPVLSYTKRKIVAIAKQYLPHVRTTLATKEIDSHQNIGHNNLEATGSSCSQFYYTSTTAEERLYYIVKEVDKIVKEVYYH